MCEVLDRIENRGIQQGIQQGIQKGIEQGIQQGDNDCARLMSTLFAQGRIEDAKRAAEDQEYRHMLIRELSVTRKT